MLAGCGVSQPLISALGALPQSAGLITRTNRTHYKVLYSFSAAPDGNNPDASLIDVGGTLYGTTSSGGSHFCSRAPCGTVFSITTGGTEKVLHSFSGRGGANPVGPAQEQ
ncbi:MAG: choice-of-anchor tandem repeat GloVer-containing protein [Candidatus Cybelea sp.]